MGVKIIFIGNIFGGDDGIGPRLYEELKDHPDLKKYELMELGVIGFDMLNYVGRDDRLIIIDAVRTDSEIGKVVILGEDDLSKDLSVVSQHDFGVEQTAAILRTYEPDMDAISLVGIYVRDTKAFDENLSEEISGMLPRIKEDVLKCIRELAG